MGRMLALIACGFVFSLPAFSAQTAMAQADQVLEEIVVVGRQPGPPLWKISRDGHALWILPLVDMYPKKMRWDSAHVEQLVAASQEYIARPRHEVNLDASPALIFRAIGLYGKMTGLPSGRTLGNVLPADLYKRFSVLRTRYFRGSRRIMERRPAAAADAMKQAILKHENLQELDYERADSPALIMDPLNKWLKRNKAIRRTSPLVTATVKLSKDDFKALDALIRGMIDDGSILPWEIGCLEKGVTYFEKDLGPAKRRANAWARGHADDLVDPVPVYDWGNSCDDPEIDAAALEKLGDKHPNVVALINLDEVRLEQASRDVWLAAAERALSRSETSFGVLAVDDVVGPDSLVARLEARGYKVEVSSE